MYKKSFLSGSLLSMIEQGFSSVTSFLTTIIIAHSCSMQTAGQYALILSLSLIVLGLQRVIIAVPFSVHYIQFGIYFSDSCRYYFAVPWRKSKPFCKWNRILYLFRRILIQRFFQTTLFWSWSDWELPYYEYHAMCCPAWNADFFPFKSVFEYGSRNYRRLLPCMQQSLYCVDF